MSTGDAPSRTDGLGRIVRSLNSRNYRLFFIGQFISLVGTWLTQVATSWLVYRLTHDTMMLGAVNFASQIPAFFLAPIAGVMVDRWPLRRVLVITQTCYLCVSASLAALTLSGAVSIPLVIGLYIIHGLINAVDIPARQSFVMQLVERREDLPNAIALNSTMFNSARFLGPTMAGILIAVVGEGLCYSLDAASYLAVIAALLMLVIQPLPQRVQPRNFMVELKEGLKYAGSFLPIRALLINLSLVTLCGIQYAVLMPAFARDVLHGDSRLQGFLMGAAGLGAAVGGIFLAARTSVRGLGRIIPMASAGLGVALIAFGLSQNRYLSISILAVIGFCMITQTAASNTLLQSVADDDKRGRVMSLFAMCFQGTMPLGSLMAGFLARPERLGPGRTIMVAGLTCLLAAWLFARQLGSIRRLARPILEERGLLGRPV